MSALVKTQDGDLAGLATQINAEHEAADKAWREGVTDALVHARSAGRLLIDAKAQCPHGAWSAWIETNCHFDARTARQYMQVVREWGAIEAKRHGPAVLSLTKAISIIAPPKPATIITATAVEITNKPTVRQSEQRLGGIELSAPIGQQPAPTSSMGRAFAARLRREPTPEEAAESKARQDLASRVLKTVQIWHRDNAGTTVEMICDALRDVVIRLQDGEVETGQ